VVCGRDALRLYSVDGRLLRECPAAALATSPSGQQPQFTCAALPSSEYAHAHRVLVAGDSHGGISIFRIDRLEVVHRLEAGSGSGSGSGSGASPKVPVVDVAFAHQDHTVIALLRSGELLSFDLWK